jgi:hypothetical protein
LSRIALNWTLLRPWWLESFGEVNSARSCLYCFWSSSEILSQSSGSFRSNRRTMPHTIGLNSKSSLGRRPSDQIPIENCLIDPKWLMLERPRMRNWAMLEIQNCARRMVLHPVYPIGGGTRQWHKGLKKIVIVAWNSEGTRFPCHPGKMPKVFKYDYVTMSSTTILWISKLFSFGSTSLFIRIFLDDISNQIPCSPWPGWPVNSLATKPCLHTIEDIRLSRDGLR